MNDVIEIEKLSFAYYAKPILKDVDMSIGEGEYVAIVGPNGAGKSTMLKCLNRILRTMSGTIKVYGKDICQYKQKEIGKLIGYVPQTREQMFPYTVYEFVLMGRYPYMSPLSPIKKEDRKVVDEAIAICGIEEFSNRLIQNLSGGERQKVYLAAALAQQPKILLLDEPTAHLDPKYHMEIQRTISQVAREKKMTVLHVTHDLSHLTVWSQKVIALKEGRICFDGKPEDILDNDNLYNTFGTHFLTLEHPENKIKIIVPEVDG